MEVVGIAVALLFVPALVGGLLLWQAKRTRERKEAIEARGWRYTPVARGFTVEGDRDGMPWKITVRRSSGKNGSTSTKFEAPAEPIDGVVLAGPRVPAMIAGIDLGGVIVQKLLELLLGDRAGELRDVKLIDHGGAMFREKYSVYGNDPAVAARLITPEFEQAYGKAANLLRQPPAVLRWRDEVVVQLGGDHANLDRIDAIVDLGSLLVFDPG